MFRTLPNVCAVTYRQDCSQLLGYITQLLRQLLILILNTFQLYLFHLSSVSQVCGRSMPDIRFQSQAISALQVQFLPLPLLLSQCFYS